LSLLAITTDESESIGGAVELVKRIPAQRVILPRATSASASRRDLEKFLTAEHVAYDSPDLAQPLRGPGDVRWDFCDDGAPAGEKASTQSALCIRVSTS